jgi:hypothetical protein
MCILCAKNIFFPAGVKKQQEKLKLLEKQVLLKEQSSSSFIEPPATGHHQWSGAKRFSKIIFILQYFLQYTKYGERHFR